MVAVVAVAELTVFSFIDRYSIISSSASASTFPSLCPERETRRERDDKRFKVKRRDNHANEKVLQAKKQASKGERYLD